ncbi:T9SS type A sorting domain-containing protein [Flavobacterium humi]|uniref:T9SS type A sorting domain-containing protein n=2 Tax=Flavobacterium humi TaxID=2562683 RepID=A0A4Z0LDG8_9FLAO|nr:T9SS type A sorting domain-containing protein [Flavobacterium humi]
MGFSQKLSFDYDAAGNQILRQLCTNCHSKNSNGPSKEIADIKEEDLQKFYPEDVISYYPNPVKEQLYLKWELINNNKMNTIQLYALSGQLLKLYDKLENTDNYTMSFQNLPQGLYTLLLSYTNGEQKSIKIIKE